MEEIDVFRINADDDDDDDGDDDEDLSYNRLQEI